MAPQLPIETAQLAAMFAQCVTFGIHLIAYIYAMLLLLRRSRGGYVNWIFVVGGTALVIIATIDVSVGLRQNLEAFVQSRSGGAAAYFADISNRLTVMKSVDVDVQFLLGDGLLIYRCFVVYQKNWLVVALPVVLWLGLLAATIRTNMLFATIGSAASGAVYNPAVLVPWITSIDSLTLGNNIILTSLIAGRILTAQRQLSKYFPSHKRNSEKFNVYTTAARVVIESGLVYTVFTAITLALYVRGSNAFYPMVELLVQIIVSYSQLNPRGSRSEGQGKGINFDLIIIRVTTGTAYDPTQAEKDQQVRSIRFTNFRSNNPENSRSTEDHDLPGDVPGRTSSALGSMKKRSDDVEMSAL